MGVVVHTGDFRSTPPPWTGKIIDLGRFGELGKQGVLALLCDSTNVERPGYTQSELSVGGPSTSCSPAAPSAFILTTFASNIHRVQQAITTAANTAARWPSPAAAWKTS